MANFANFQNSLGYRLAFRMIGEDMADDQREVLAELIEAAFDAGRDSIGGDDIGGIVLGAAEDHGGREENVDDDAPAKNGRDVAAVTMVVNGVTRRVGERVRASRRKWRGITKVCTIVKFRNDQKKSMLLKPNDGGAEYWAINRHVEAARPY